MQYFKAFDGAFHVLEDGVDATSLANFPVDAVLSTEEEYQNWQRQLYLERLPQILEGMKEVVRTARESILNRLSGIAFTAQLSGDTATTQAFIAVRQGLLDITKNLPDNPELFTTEVTNRYRALVALCTSSMVKAFAEIDL